MTEKKDFFLEVYHHSISESQYRDEQFVKHKLSNGKTELVFAITDTSNAVKGRIYESTKPYISGDSIISIIISSTDSFYETINVAIFEKKQHLWKLKNMLNVVKTIQITYPFSIKFLEQNTVLIKYHSGWERPDEVIVLHLNNTIDRYQKLSQAEATNPRLFPPPEK